MSELHEGIRITVDSAMFILIWLVQRIIYPAFYSIEPDRFKEWHHKYMRAIAFFVIPLMLIQAACIALRLYLDPHTADIAAAGAVLAAWLVTFGISAPCHRKLQLIGRSEAVIARLIATNWWRTACWTLAWVLGLFG